MNFGWTDEEWAFRGRVRAFIDEHWRDTNLEADPGEGRRQMARHRDYQQQLAESGWLTHAWPEEYGGRGASHMEQLIFNEESAVAGASTGIDAHDLGDDLAGALDHYPVADEQVLGSDVVLVMQRRLFDGGTPDDHRL